MHEVLLHGVRKRRKTLMLSAPNAYTGLPAALKSDTEKSQTGGGSVTPLLVLIQAAEEGASSLTLRP